MEASSNGIPQHGQTSCPGEPGSVSKETSTNFDTRLRVSIFGVVPPFSQRETAGRGYKYRFRKFGLRSTAFRSKHRQKSAAHSLKNRIWPKKHRRKAVRRCSKRTLLFAVRHPMFPSFLSHSEMDGGRLIPPKNKQGPLFSFLKCRASPKASPLQSARCAAFSASPAFYQNLYAQPQVVNRHLAAIFCIIFVESYRSIRR